MRVEVAYDDKVVAYEGKPIISSVLGDGYVLVDLTGDDTDFAVFHQESGAPMGVGTKVAALQEAKDRVTRYDDQKLASWFHRWMMKRLPPKGHSAPERKRREPRTEPSPSRITVFNKTKGQCFYCLTKLELEGKWHSDHMVSRTNGGSNRLENRVPACAPCNWRKGRMNSDEFLALIERERNAKQSFDERTQRREECPSK